MNRQRIPEKPHNSTATHFDRHIRQQCKGVEEDSLEHGCGGEHNRHRRVRAVELFAHLRTEVAPHTAVLAAELLHKSNHGVD